MTVFTLGGTSFIIVSKLIDNSICITGSTGLSIRINEEQWGLAMDYLKEIEKDTDTWRVASYARPNFLFREEKRYTSFGPSFPAICKAYWCYHKR